MQQDSLFSSDSPQQDQVAGPVTCLGKTFANDQARRDFFLALLAEKLKDPEFRKIEGFPIGSDEDILNLSDPPYYTACPNPWIGDFIAEWEAQKTDSDEEYHREPFAADVSEGKNDPIYNAHSYHTKVPHKAIMRYILHYTKPGDIIFDGFCGSGMTGVAAQMCGDREVVLSLGYQVMPDNTILQEEIDKDGKKNWRPFSKLGVRKAILNDLSPAASFISYNYNSPVDITLFKHEAQRILKEVEDECGWMYETKHPDGRIGKINYTVWSDVFLCPECSSEIIFSDIALDRKTGSVKSEFSCSHCGTMLNKKKLERVWVTEFDDKLQLPIKKAKQTPVFINYSIGGDRFEKELDSGDWATIEQIQSRHIPYEFPSSEISDGFNTRQPLVSHGVSHKHHFYTKRNLWTLSALYNKAKVSQNKAALFFVEYAALGFSKLARYVPTHFSQVNQYLSGTLYLGSQQVEVSPRYILSGKYDRLIKRELTRIGSKRCSIISASDTSRMSIPDCSFDYIFIDPPFGANLNYSELNTLWEAWLGVETEKSPEAIENSVQGKSIHDYRNLMSKCFRETYRLIKPGRWMTIEFSNTKASVWNSIQTALTEAGFIVANVSALDKKQGSFKAVTTPTAVKQDLVISVYKPNGDFENRFSYEAETEAGVWDFVRTHLKYLPVVKQHGTLIQFVPERDPRILFDQMVAYYVRKGYPVPISSQEFQLGLAQRFIERDGMFFLQEQAAEYDKYKLTSGELIQASLFVKDEASAIDWLRQLIKNKPQTFADINPLYMQQLSGFSKHEVTLDLRELLSQNFLCYDGQDEVPDQIHSYLSSNWKELRNLAKNDPALVAKAKGRWYVPDPNKAGDLEKLREKSLLKEFEEYKVAKKKLKVFRIEAVRVGFKKLWEQQEFAALIAVAEKLPSNVLEEDPVLLMYFDQAVTLSQLDTDDEW
ncbi:DNA methyltransferase [Aeromonas caviae]